MTQRVVHRPARVRPPEPELAAIGVVTPPTLPDSAGGGGVMQVLMPIMGGGGMLLMMASQRNPVMMIAGGAMMLATVAGGVFAFISQRTGGARRFALQRRRYLEYLDEVRDDLREAAAAQRTEALHRHPHPEQLLDLVRDPHRLWERRLTDPDFLVLRAGTGRDRLWQGVSLGGAPNPLVELDPITSAAAELLVDRDRTLNDMPVAVPIDGVVSVVGPPAETRNLLRALLGQLAVLHAPDDVRVAWCVGPAAVADFEWAKWLPHCLHPDEFDGPAPRRLLATDPAGLARLLDAELTRRKAELGQIRRLGGATHKLRGSRLVVIVDQDTAGRVDLLGPGADATVADLGLAQIVLVPERRLEPSTVDVRVVCVNGQLSVEDLRPPPPGHLGEQAIGVRRRMLGAVEGVADVVSPVQVEVLARRVSPLRLVADRIDDAPLEATVDLRSLAGIADEATYDVRRFWAARPLAEFLKVPFGVGPAGEPIQLDIKEAALGGMGPHGLCVGATGSGKSEVLRTLVLILAMTHPPERLALVLVDYKGGATFAGLENLPHTSAMISNLSDDTGLVDRLRDALQGEMKRRQQILLEAGQLANITEYNRRRDAGQPLAPLPNLFVVIDEFSELLTAKPDFIELFLAIGRIGRSIGVHLLLASQRLEEGKLRGLESFLSYRLGLRTFNEQESRTVLGVPDAYRLPPLPGSGYLKVDTTVFERFKAAYVSGAYRSPSGEELVEAPARATPFELLAAPSSSTVETVTEKAEEQPEDVLAPSTMDIVVRRLRELGQPVHQIWLPPLPSALALDSITGPPAVDPAWGLTVPDPSWRGALRIPLGLLDRPTEQRQEPLLLDLAGAGGHVAIMGAPQSGKSTLLRALICGAALTHTPHDIAFYCVDLGGGTLAPLAGLPHVGGVTRMDPDRVRRTVAEIAAMLAEREALFAERGIDSPDAMRQLHRHGRLPELATADVALVIDNYPAFRSDFEDLGDMVQDVAARGLGYGIHLILTAGRWGDLRIQLQSAIGNKLELRLNDPLDSTIKRAASENLRADTPGRFLTSEALIAHGALPRIDGIADPATAQKGVEDLVAQVRSGWSGPVAPPIRMLPTLVPYQELAGQVGADPRVRLGVDETELRPVLLDLLGSDSHLLVFGDSQSGKTSLMRLLVHDLISRFGDDQVVFAVIDVRRTLLDVIPDDYLGAYAGTTSVATGLVSGVAGELRNRMPPDGVTAKQLRERSWWKGPEIVVLCDDYDLLASGGPGPLAPFLEFLPQSRDLGFHLVLARHAGGAGRAVHEPVPMRMREVGCAGLLLSGQRQEGQLWPQAYLSVQPPGRGYFIRKNRKPLLIQTAYVDPSTMEGSGVGQEAGSTQIS